MLCIVSANDGVLVDCVVGVGFKLLLGQLALEGFPGFKTMDNIQLVLSSFLLLDYAVPISAIIAPHFVCAGYPEVSL